MAATDDLTSQRARPDEKEEDTILSDDSFTESDWEGSEVDEDEAVAVGAVDDADWELARGGMYAR